MKTTKTVYTNSIGKLFTLESYDKIAGVCHVHGITKHSEMDKRSVRALHEKGSLHYISGFGDRKVLAGNFRRGQVSNFNIG